MRYLGKGNRDKGGWGEGKGEGKGIKGDVGDQGL